MSSVPSSGVGYNDSSCKGGGCELSKNTLIKERNDGTNFCGTFQDPCYSDNFMFAECASSFGTACTCDSDGDRSAISQVVVVIAPVRVQTEVVI